MNECCAADLVAAADAIALRLAEEVPVLLGSEESEASGLLYATPNNVAAVSCVLASKSIVNDLGTFSNYKHTLLAPLFL